MFSTKPSTSKDYFSLDFANWLAQGETIASVVSALSVVSGVDPAPSAMIVGEPLIATTIVSQMLQGGVPGVEYLLTFTVTTSGEGAFSARILPGARQFMVKLPDGTY